MRLHCSLYVSPDGLETPGHLLQAGGGDGPSVWRKARLWLDVRRASRRCIASITNGPMLCDLFAWARWTAWRNMRKGVGYRLNMGGRTR